MTGSGEAKCQPQSGRKREFSKKLIDYGQVLSGRRKLISKELARKLKESTGVELFAFRVKRRLLENGLRRCKTRKKPLLTEKQRKRR